MRWSYGILAAGLVLTAVNAQDDAAKKDLESLQGVWQFVSLEVEGKGPPDDPGKPIKLTIKGNKGSHPGRDGKIEEAIIRLDPSRKPKAIDMSPLSGPDKGKAALGIYFMDGDMLKICAATIGKDRPTEFKADKNVVLMVLKRER
jgi:uncharacterized protein (TIGR03067 family)